MRQLNGLSESIVRKFSSVKIYDEADLWNPGPSR